MHTLWSIDKRNKCVMQQNVGGVVGIHPFGSLRVKPASTPVKRVLFYFKGHKRPVLILSQDPVVGDRIGGIQMAGT